MTSSSPRMRVAFRLVIITIAITWVLVVWGGVVHVTESSLACPDWPLCYGQVFPEMEGKVAIEHGHRMLASTVGLLTIVLAILVWPRRDLRGWGAAAVGLVIAQGVLGGITVIWKLPTLVSTAHLGTSLLFLALLLALAWRLRAPAAAAQPPQHLAGRGLLLVGAVLVWAQSVVGALVRHTGSGLACNLDPLLCDGRLWPATAPAQLHMVHRIAGITVAAVVVGIGLCLQARARRDGRDGLALLALAGPALVLVQVLLGAFTILSGIGLVAVSAHLAVAALLLLQQLLLALAGGEGVREEGAAAVAPGVAAAAAEGRA